MVYKCDSPDDATCGDGWGGGEGKEGEIGQEDGQHEELAEPHGPPVFDEGRAQHLKHEVDLKQDGQQHAQTCREKKGPVT